MTMNDTEERAAKLKSLPFPMPSNEDVQKYIRIVIYWFSGFVTGHGFLDSTWAPVIVGGGTAAATFAWTLYGGRLIAKLNEIAKYNEVVVVQIKPSAIVEKPELIVKTDSKIIPSGPTTGL